MFSKQKGDQFPCVHCRNAHEEDGSGLVAAAIHGHLDCFDRLYQQFGLGANVSDSNVSDSNVSDFDQMGDTITDLAAQYGHLSILQYAHKHHIPWGKITCANAFAYGHLDCLRFAYECGCPWGENTWHYWYAIRVVHCPECVAYAYQNNCPHLSLPPESPEPTPSPNPCYYVPERIWSPEYM